MGKRRTRLMIITIISVLGIMGFMYRSMLDDARNDAVIAANDDRTQHNLLTNAMKDAGTDMTMQADDVMDNDRIMLISLRSICKSKDIGERMASHPYTASTRSVSIHDIRRATDSMRQDAADTREMRIELSSLSGRIASSHRSRVLHDARESLNAVMTSARSMLSSSHGRVDDESARTRLSAVISSARTTITGDDPDDMVSASKSLKSAMSAVESSMDSRRERLRRIAKAREEADARRQSETTSSDSGSSPSSSSSSTTSSRNNGTTSQSTSVPTIRSVASCTVTTSLDYCQSLIDRGGFVQMAYSGSDATVYAAHDTMGGAVILNWGVGQKVIINGTQYTVISKQYNATQLTGSGVYVQTCYDSAGDRLLIRVQ